jgi:chaperonin cofactor prefoldin
MHKLIFDLKRQMMTGLSAAVERNKKLEAQLSQARAAVKELKSRLPPDDDWIKHGALEI